MDSIKGPKERPVSYLCYQRLESIDPATFQKRMPYPWLNPEGWLTERGFHELRAGLPALELFEKRFDVKRAHGQHSHNRYTLEYRDQPEISPAWQAFIQELRGERYQRFLCQLFGTRSVTLNFHWHYTPRACSVSPHCDARHKMGSHIFYFNTEQDWDPAWGGETLILDDGGRFDRRSAPRFEDFQQIIPSQTVGNRSLLFRQDRNSWHGVREIACPDNRLRKVFIAVINRTSPVARVRRLLRRAA